MESQSANYLQIVSVSCVLHFLDSSLPSRIAFAGLHSKEHTKFPSKGGLHHVTFVLIQAHVTS